MNRDFMKKYFSLNLIIGLPLCVLLTACSDDKPATTPATSTSTQASAQTANTNSVDSPTDPTPEAEQPQKDKFKKDFAAQCVERELNNPQNPSADADKFAKACECISAEIMKDLTDEEAEKYLSEHEHPQSLRIKYEAAAYECLQEKVKPEEPKITKLQ